MLMESVGKLKDADDKFDHFHPRRVYGGPGKTQAAAAANDKEKDELWDKYISRVSGC